MEKQTHILFQYGKHIAMLIDKSRVVVTMAPANEEEREQPNMKAFVVRLAFGANTDIVVASADEWDEAIELVKRMQRAITDGDEIKITWDSPLFEGMLDEEG